MCFNITICEKKEASIKFGLSVHKALRSKKNKKKQDERWHLPFNPK